MAETLLKVYLGKKTETLISQADRLSPKLARKIKDLGRKAIRDVSDLALKAYLSKSAFDTGEFRGLGLGDGFIRKSLSSTSFTIYIASGTHLGRDRKPVIATELSRILDVGVGRNGNPLLRSQKSVPISSAGTSSFGTEAARTPTKDWQGKALRAFKNALPKYLSTLRLY